MVVSSPAVSTWRSQPRVNSSTCAARVAVTWAPRLLPVLTELEGRARRAPCAISALAGPILTGVDVAASRRRVHFVHRTRLSGSDRMDDRANAVAPC